MTDAVLTYVDEEPNGLAWMIGGLIEANLHHHPNRHDLLKPAVIDLVAVDADTAVTVTLARGRVSVANGSADGQADLRVSADGRSLIEVAGAPLRFGLPDVFRSGGRVLARKVLAKQIRIEGLLRHPAKLVRLTKLLSVV